MLHCYWTKENVGAAEDRAKEVGREIHMMIVVCTMLAIDHVLLPMLAIDHNAGHRS